MEPGRQSVAFVTSIHEDRDGVLWLSTVDSGLLKLDRERTRFVRYIRDPGNPNSLPENFVRSLFEDREGMMWVGTGSGLSRFPRKGSPFVNYQHEAGNPQSLAHNPDLERAGRQQGLPVDLRLGQVEPAGSSERPASRFTSTTHDDRHSISHNSISAITRGPFGHTLVWHLRRRAQSF